MKMKIVLAACAASLALAACTTQSPTAARTMDPKAPTADGVPTLGSGGLTDPPPPAKTGVSTLGSGG